MKELKWLARVNVALLMVIVVRYIFTFYVFSTDNRACVLLVAFVVYCVLWIVTGACSYLDEPNIVHERNPYRNMLCQMSCGQLLHITSTKKIREK